MDLLRKAVRLAFDHAEAWLGKCFPPHWNPLLNLGALGFFFYWIITASGIYVYIFFDTGVEAAYASVEYMTNEQWYLAGVMRSLHRYASDGLIVVMLLHLLREFGLDHYRGVRWFSWMIGIPIMIFIYVSGITGYWLVWDQLAQYVALVSTEWLDKLPIFGEPIARNFVAPGSLDSRFFTLMMFIHIAVPLIALILLWVHLQRISKPRINPPRGLAAGTFLSMLALSLLHPAVSQGPADLARVPGALGLDWFYLPLFPVLESLPGPLTWSAALLFLGILVAMPWLPPMRKAPAATVDLANCNGCSRCYLDCPYAAIEMIARTDGRPFEAEAKVIASRCVACGICAGACPTATPYRRKSELLAGIEVPDLLVADVRQQLHAAADKLIGNARIIVFACGHGVDARALASDSVGVVELRCIGQLPPSFIDYALSKKLADGVMLSGCAENACHARQGIAWTTQRINATRDPHLRGRVPRDRLRMCWAGRTGQARLHRELESFAEALADRPVGDDRGHGVETSREAELTDG